MGSCIKIKIYPGAQKKIKPQKDIESASLSYPELAKVKHIINSKLIWFRLKTTIAYCFLQFNEKELLQVSKSFMKKLKEKYPCI